MGKNHPGFNAIATKGKHHPGFAKVAKKMAAPVKGVGPQAPQAPVIAPIAPTAPIGPPQMPGEMPGGGALGK